MPITASVGTCNKVGGANVRLVPHARIRMREMLARDSIVDEAVGYGPRPRPLWHSLSAGLIS